MEENPLYNPRYMDSGWVFFYLCTAKSYKHSICSLIKSLYWRIEQVTEVYLSLCCKLIIWNEFGETPQLDENNEHKSRSLTVETSFHYYGQKTNQWCTRGILHLIN